MRMEWHHQELVLKIEAEQRVTSMIYTTDLNSKHRMKDRHS